MKNRLVESIMIVLFLTLLAGCGSKEPLNEDIAVEVSMQGIDADINENVAVGTLLSKSITLNNVTTPISDVQILLSGEGSEDFNVSVEAGSSANSYLGKVALLHSLEGKGGTLYDLNATLLADGERFGPVAVKIHVLDVREWTIVSFCDEMNGTEAWISDGTSRGTKPLANFNPEGNSRLTTTAVTFGDKVYFAMDIADGNGTTLWESNGTKEGTKMLLDINNSHDSDTIDELIKVNDKLFFSANDKEIWVSDGTKEATTMLKDINASRIYALSSYHDKLYFIAIEAVGTYKPISLWESDGTAVGTKMTAVLNDISEKPEMISFMNDTLYLAVKESQILKIKKANMQQSPLSFTDDESIANSGIWWMGVYHDNLHLITYDDTTSHSAIWKKESGNFTKLPLDIDFYFEKIQLFDGKFLFSASQAEESEVSQMKRQLWKSDTTEEGSSLIKEAICPLY
jgi:ELWxxDGT repeat protein